MLLLAIIRGVVVAIPICIFFIFYISYSLLLRVYQGVLTLEQAVRLVVVLYRDDDEDYSTNDYEY
jgi:hypothetical protein